MIGYSDREGTIKPLNQCKCGGGSRCGSGVGLVTQVWITAVCGYVCHVYATTANPLKVGFSDIVI